MRVISCKAENFASYRNLEFDFTYSSLALIQGSTGSGKSTLCDVVPWGLFGVTAKGGPVSDVVSWSGGVTKVTIELEVMGKKLTVIRKRGLKAKDNDLSWIEAADPVERRGKDLIDSQKLLNGLLGGIDAELYLAGAYYHEFSQTAQFFITTPKNRRAICEQLVDLTLATKLQTELKDKARAFNDQLDECESQISIAEVVIRSLKEHQKIENNKADEWNTRHMSAKQRVAGLYDQFEKSRKQTISKKCNACGTLLEHPHEVINTDENPHLGRLAELETEVNPHTGSVKDYSDEIKSKETEIKKAKINLRNLTIEIDDIEQLQDIVATYRSVTITNTIKSLEQQTNQLLTKHFDSECQVNFTIEDSDKLDFTIQKDGNECSYTQLSKGQRCLLKLCFGVSVMRCVQDHHGVNFAQVFFDESVDGLDSNMKTKAYGLFESLAQSYESIYVVEHSEALKALFEKSYTVELINGESVICQH